jgi:hypothetical protein
MKIRDHARQHEQPPEKQETCLSDAPHDERISNHMVHFLGCIEYHERENFFAEDSPLWRTEVEHEHRLLENVKPEELKSAEIDAKTKVRKKMKSWEKECDNELRRIEYLRKTILADVKESHFATKLDESRKTWKQQEEYKRGIRLVREWRRRNNKVISEPNTNAVETPAGEKYLSKYEPEKDIKVHMILYGNEDFNNSLNIESTEARYAPPPAKATRLIRQQKSKVDESLSGASETKRGDRLRTLHDLSKRTEGFSYVHFPANNMTVSFDFWISPVLNLRDICADIADVYSG